MAGQDQHHTEDDTPMEDQNTDNTEVREEYDFLDTQLDELNSALDVLEQKNDDITKKLKDLLQSSRAMRQELKNNSVNTPCDN